MEGTGRVREPLGAIARAIVFDRHAQDLWQEVPFYVQIDRAHLVMLLERGLVPPEHGRRVLEALDMLVADAYAPLRDRPMPRGLYLLYERWLCETVGEAAGGAVHFGRSRNDINATILRLRLRPVYARLVREALRLLAVLVRQAERHGRLTMPVYTHYQAALPITFGHYLAGVGTALLRDVEGLEDAVRDIDRCPLGAGAAGGTTVPLDVHRTAQLLGFGDGVQHSVDAVASRDLVLRVLAASTVLGITISRLATDLLLWSTAEFDLIRFPDSLVGSSSMLPQKRNAFLLEHVQGRAGAPLGAFTAAATAMHATPFSNSVAVGTESVRPLWDAAERMAQAVTLVRLMTAGARPQPARMWRRTVDGCTAATELANRLVCEGGLSFRQAHHEVGALVNEASCRGESLETAAARLAAAHGLGDAFALDPRAVAEASAYGGGPASSSRARVVDDLRRGWSHMAGRLADRSRAWAEGSRRLQDAVAAIVGGGPTASTASSVAVGGGR